MKNHGCLTPLAVPFHSDRRSHSFPATLHRLDGARVRRQRRMLLGVSILLILCWAIGAIWLIDMRRGERSTTEVLVQQGMIAALYPGEMVSGRQTDTGKISLFLVKAE